jgi:hypothetical protein
MKKLILAVLTCCTLSVVGMSVNFDAKLNAIERRINALKAERTSIEHKNSSICDELNVVKKKRAELRNKIKILESNNESYTISHFKTRIEKIENDIKLLTLFQSQSKLLLDIDKINLNIDMSNVELIKAEIKTGRTPRIPLNVAKCLTKRNKVLVKVNEATIKVRCAKIKEKVAKVKYLKNIIETGEKFDKISKGTNNSYDYICNTNIEICKLKVKRAMLILNLEQSRKKTVQARIKEAQTGAEFSKIQYKFCKTFFKFNKIVDEKNLMSFFYHN